MKLLFWLVYNLALGYNETANPISLRSRETSAQFIDRLLSKLSFIPDLQNSINKRQFTSIKICLVGYDKMVHPNYYNKKPTNITGLVGFDFNAAWVGSAVHSQWIDLWMGPWSGPHFKSNL